MRLKCWVVVTFSTLTDKIAKATDKNREATDKFSKATDKIGKATDKSHQPKPDPIKKPPWEGDVSRKRGEGTS
jgi:hypothetical protein